MRKKIVISHEEEKSQKLYAFRTNLTQSDMNRKRNARDLLNTKDKNENNQLCFGQKESKKKNRLEKKKTHGNHPSLCQSNDEKKNESKSKNKMKAKAKTTTAETTTANTTIAKTATTTVTTKATTTTATTTATTKT